MAEWINIYIYDDTWQTLLATLANYPSPSDIIRDNFMSDPIVWFSKTIWWPLLKPNISINNQWVSNWDSLYAVYSELKDVTINNWKVYSNSVMCISQQASNGPVITTQDGEWKRDRIHFSNFNWLCLNSGTICPATTSPTSSSKIKRIWRWTQAQYDAISSKDTNTLYIIE